MYKIAVIDDEKFVCDAMAKAINWEKHGCVLAGTANDGLSGFKLIKDEQIDIAFLDIRMPIMTGIEVAQRVAAEKLGTKIIILSGYADFKYAKSCMKHGVRHYLLKPADIEEVFEALLDCISELPEKREKAVYSRNIMIAIKYIEENLFKPELTLGFLSNSVLDMNPEYFCRLFKSETGKHFTGFVIERRMNKAKDLLKSSNLKIYEIARLVGFFNNEPYFGQVFKRMTGMTPQEYRDSHI